MTKVKIREYKFGPWALRPLVVNRNEFTPFADQFDKADSPADEFFLWFISRLGVDQWYCVGAEIHSPSRAEAKYIYDRAELQTLDAFLSYMGSPWEDVSDVDAGVAFGAIHFNFAQYVTDEHKTRILQRSNSELDTERAEEEEEAMQHFGVQPQRLTQTLRVRVVAVDVDGDEHNMGVFNQGVTMEPNTLIDVATTDRILWLDPRSSLWESPADSPGPRDFKSFFIHSAVDAS